MAAMTAMAAITQLTATHPRLRFKRGDSEATMAQDPAQEPAQQSAPPINSYFSALQDYSAEQLAQLLPDAAPLKWAGDRLADTAIVCIHGFRAMPYGVRPIAEKCAQGRFDTYAPLLPGHGWRDPQQQRQDFSRVTLDRLLTALRTEVAQLRDRYKRVYVYGDSLGGALALALASEGLVEACATTAPALMLPFRGAVLARYFGWLNINLPKPPSQRFYTPCYDFENSRAGHAVWAVSRYARTRLEQIQCPVFIAHSPHDPTIPPAAAELARDRCQGPVELQWFSNSGHVLPLDCQGEEVSQAIAQFFSEVTLNQR